MIRLQAVLQILVISIPLAENANGGPRLPHTANMKFGRRSRPSADTEANAAVAAMEKMTNDGKSS